MSEHPMNLSGIRIIESAYLTQDGEPITIRRTWRERLFSRPWTPQKATRVVIPQVPYEGAIEIGRNTVVMHPAIVRRLRNIEHPA